MLMRNGTEFTTCEMQPCTESTFFHSACLAPINITKYKLPSRFAIKTVYEVYLIVRSQNLSNTKFSRCVFLSETMLISLYMLSIAEQTAS